MTRKEIEEAKVILEGWQDGCSYTDEQLYNAVETAIKVLGQETVLDKIIAKIMQLDYDEESVDYDYNDMTMTEIIHKICREEVLQIIEKYKAEIEVETQKREE